MNFDLYKPRLFDYLRAKGLQPQKGSICCFNPKHNDPNPSCKLDETSFYCFGCQEKGDIYDAVRLLEGIEDRAEQYKFVEKFCGGHYEPKPIERAKKPEEEKSKFTPNLESIKKMDSYIFSNPHAKEVITAFLAQRIQKTTSGKVKQYPDEILNNLIPFFGYWPGMDIAQQELGNNVIYTAGIPTKKNATGHCSWEHSGVVIKIGNGYKLHYYEEGKEHCEKRGSLSCSTFPTPQDIKDKEEVILVEGEMDALVARAAGFTNVFSVGGTSGLTKPKIKQYLLDVKKITLLFDADTAGKTAAGIIACNTQSVPEKLLQAGFSGRIETALLTKYKDPDEAICNGHPELIQQALDNAKEWIEPDKSDLDSNGKLTYTTLGRFFRELRKTKITKQELFDTLCALVKVSMNTEKINKLLIDNGASAHLLEHRTESEVKPQYLKTIAAKYLSYYWQNKFLEQFGPDKESASKPLVPVKYKQFKDDKDLNNFYWNTGEFPAAMLVSKVLVNRFIYVEDEKKFYFFNNHIWQRVSNVSAVIYNILASFVQQGYYIDEYKDSDDFKKALNKTRVTIQQRRFLLAVEKILSGVDTVFHESITFDGPQVQETLTLLDGVLDFSGKELKIRDSRPEEFRFRTLPYKVDDIISASEPEKFLKFMKSNFKNQDTLETLFYYLSLIPSRCAQYKVGGIFIGTGGTGKTTTMKIISDLYPKMTTPIPRQVIMLNKDIRNYGGGANPEIAELEGMGAGISDETQRNDMLNSAVFKQLTGGGELKARRLYANAKVFKPTAQTIILTNYLPRFDNKDPATIDRMVVIPFSITHKRGEDKDFKDENDIFDLLRPEYPGIVKFFAEYYIKLKNEHRGKIPLSKECQSYKDDYIEDQATDLDRFVKENIEFVKDENAFVKVKDLYERYCTINDIELNEKGQPVDKDAWSQNKLTHFLKSDYTEIHIKQKRFGGAPEQIIINMRLKPLPEEKEETAKKHTPAKQQELIQPAKTQPKPVQQPHIEPSMPTENPFEDEDRNDFDIF